MENDACESLFSRILFFVEDALHIFPRASSFSIYRLIVLFIKNKICAIWFVIIKHSD